MKTVVPLLLMAAALGGCMTVELPNVVSDTAKLGKDAYRSFRGKETPVANQVAHTYVGQEAQTVAQIKEGCVNEATAKLATLIGREVKSTVLENTIATVGSSTVANCKVAVAETTGQAAPAK